MSTLTQSLPAMQLRPAFIGPLPISLEARGIGIRLHLADVQLCRQPDQPWGSLTEGEKHSYDYRGRVALATGDIERLDWAREEAAIALRIHYADRVTSIEEARALADSAIGAWLRTMAGGK